MHSVCLEIRSPLRQPTGASPVNTRWEAAVYGRRPFISAKWSKLTSVRKRNVLALQPDAAPVRGSRAVSPNDPSTTSPRAGVVSLNQDRIAVRGDQATHF